MASLKMDEQLEEQQVYMERHLKKCNKIPNQLATGEKAAN
jgi:hypothetical protein